METESIRRRGRPRGYSPTNGAVQSAGVAIPAILVACIPDDGRTVSEQVRALVDSGVLLQAPRREGPIGAPVQIRCYPKKKAAVQAWIRAHRGLRKVGELARRVDNGRWLDDLGQPLTVPAQCPCCGRMGSPRDPIDPAAEVAAAVAEAAERLGLPVPTEPAQVAELIRRLMGGR